MHAKLHIQCTDKQTGEKGDFLTDIETGERVTPVFNDLIVCFEHIRSNGWNPQPYCSAWPNGHYRKANPCNY